MRQAGLLEQSRAGYLRAAQSIWHKLGSCAKYRLLGGQPAEGERGGKKKNSVSVSLIIAASGMAVVQLIDGLVIPCLRNCEQNLIYVRAQL